MNLMSLFGGGNTASTINPNYISDRDMNTFRDRSSQMWDPRSNANMGVYGLMKKGGMDNIATQNVMNQRSGNAFGGYNPMANQRSLMTDINEQLNNSYGGYMQGARQQSTGMLSQAMQGDQFNASQGQQAAMFNAQQKQQASMANNQALGGMFSNVLGMGTGLLGQYMGGNQAMDYLKQFQQGNQQAPPIQQQQQYNMNPAFNGGFDMKLYNSKPARSYFGNTFPWGE